MDRRQGHEGQELETDLGVNADSPPEGTGVLRRPMQVERWHVVFHMKRHEHLLEKLVRGRFGHVSAFAHLIGPGVWLMIDFSPLTGPHCVLWPFLDDPHQMPLGLAEWTAN